MKKHLISFLKRGLTFCVGGPIILAIVYGILGATGAAATLDSLEVCRGILTVTLMAFIAAGITVVYDNEKLPLFWAILLHGTALYLDYILVYLLNGWLASGPVPILVFTAIFIAGFAIIWLLIYFFTKRSANQLNRKLNG
jgi:hypothetical protein